MPRTKKQAAAQEEKESKILTPGGKYYYACGKRKTSIATVRLYKGKGAITVNNKAVNEFFPVKHLIGLIKSPLKLTGTLEKYDVIAQVQGGGINSQAEAIRHAITKTLLESDPLNKPTLKAAGMLTRDPRIKERKKYGLKRARKAPQFSKR
ncbi:MAG: 30S ribosomal protein S9 [Candidatus Gracilibacteria bacterium]|jgi:small subunit ribosomal protein S9